MTAILRDLSPSAPVTAIEANLFGFYPSFQRRQQCETHDDLEM